LQEWIQQDRPGLAMPPRVAAPGAAISIDARSTIEMARMIRGETRFSRRRATS
jgi:hypothetical protein